MQASYIPDSTLSADSFHSPASLGISEGVPRDTATHISFRTVFRIHPLYDEHFTQASSLQTKLFSACNSICSVFKVLTSFRLFVFRSSVASDSLRRSIALYNARKPWYIKILYQKCILCRISCRARFHPDIRTMYRMLGFPLAS